MFKFMLLALAENSIQLVPDGTLLVHIVLIILMIFILNITLFGPINQILEEREQQTLGRTDEAQTILRQVRSKLERHEQALRMARTEGYNFLEQQRAVALRKRQDLLNSLRGELQSSIDEQKRLIQMQVEQARLKLEDESHQIAKEVSRQILRRRLN